MALSLSVPKEAQRRLAVLAGMSDSVFDEFLKFIRDNIEHLNAHDAAETAVSAKLKGNASDAIEVMPALLPLLISYRADGDGGSADDILHAVVASIGGSSFEFFKEKDLLSKLKSRLGALLSDETVALKAKAMSLAAERGSVLNKIRIISDIRPIFGGAAKNEIKVQAASVIHTLVLSCVEHGKAVSHHIAIDSGDLKRLRIAIDRAATKEKELAVLMASANVSQIVID